MAKTVLLIEDENKIRTIVKDYFVKSGFHVLEAADGKEGLYIFQNENVDLILLDIHLPELDGWSVCRRIRQGSDVPIIMLTARGDDEDMLLGFELKADEYITKPFNPQVVVARAKMLLKRVEGTILEDVSVIERDGLTINKLSREVMMEGKILKLTPKEFDILLFFIENEGRVLSREVILNKLWGYDYFGDIRVVDNHIKKVRKALAEKSYLISTVFGVGYKFEVAE